MISTTVGSSAISKRSQTPKVLKCSLALSNFTACEDERHPRATKPHGYKSRTNKVRVQGFQRLSRQGRGSDHVNLAPQCTVHLKHDYVDEKTKDYFNKALGFICMHEIMPFSNKQELKQNRLKRESSCTGEWIWINYPENRTDGQRDRKYKEARPKHSLKIEG